MGVIWTSRVEMSEKCRVTDKSFHRTKNENGARVSLCLEGLTQGPCASSRQHAEIISQREKPVETRRLDNHRLRFYNTTNMPWRPPAKLLLHVSACTIPYMKCDFCFRTMSHPARTSARPFPRRAQLLNVAMCN